MTLRSKLAITLKTKLAMTLRTNAPHLIPMASSLFIFEDNLQADPVDGAQVYSKLASCAHRPSLSVFRSD